MTIKEDNLPLVEVIVLAYNSKENLDNCLKSLKKTDYNNFIISVVDQSSSDGTPEMVKSKYPKVNLIKNKKNNGFTGGNNQILRKSRAKYCIMLNDDTIQDKKWIKELVTLAEKDEKIAAIQPKVLSLRNKEYFEYAGAGGGYIDKYGYPFCRGRIFEDVEKDFEQYDNKKRVFWCSGVAMFVRNSILKKVGYLDDDFFIYSEELDLCWRMNLAGYKLFYNPRSVIYHLGSATANRKEFSFIKKYRTHRNVLITLLKNYSQVNWIKLMPFKLLLEFVAFLEFLFIEPRRSLAILSANLSVLMDMGSIIKKNRQVQKIRRLNDKKIMKLMLNRSLVIDYFLFKKKKFSEYQKNIEDYN